MTRSFKTTLGKFMLIPDRLDPRRILLFHRNLTGDVFRLSESITREEALSRICQHQTGLASWDAKNEPMPEGIDSLDHWQTQRSFVAHREELIAAF